MRELNRHRIAICAKASHKFNSATQRCTIQKRRHYPICETPYHKLSWAHLVKLGEVQHHDIGQMNLYMGYFAAEENTEGDNPPIGIILSRQKDELLVEYATYGMNSQLFVQKYQLYLPDRDALNAEIERTLLEAGQ